MPIRIDTVPFRQVIDVLAKAILGFSQKDIATEHGITQAYVSLICLHYGLRRRPQYKARVAKRQRPPIQSGGIRGFESHPGHQLDG